MYVPVMWVWLSTLKAYESLKKVVESIIAKMNKMKGLIKELRTTYDPNDSDVKKPGAQHSTTEYYQRGLIYRKPASPIILRAISNVESEIQNLDAAHDKGENILMQADLEKGNWPEA